MATYHCGALNEGHFTSEKSEQLPLDLLNYYLAWPLWNDFKNNFNRLFASNFVLILIAFKIIILTVFSILADQAHFVNLDLRHERITHYHADGDWLAGEHFSLFFECGLLLFLLVLSVVDC